MRIGIDVGATHIRMAIISDGRILKKITEPTKVDASEIEVLMHLKMMLRQVVNTNIRGIGIGVPSIVDTEEGIVYNVASIPSLKEVHLRELFEKEFRIPVYVNSSSNCFAIAEKKVGQASFYSDIVCLSLGLNVAAGVIVNHSLYPGNNTGAGQLGCMPYLNHDFNYYCGGRYFETEHGLTGKEVLSLAIKGDDNALRIWSEYGRNVGNLLTNILFVYDPQAIVIGGGISLSHEFFSKSMCDVLATFPHPQVIKRLKLFQSVSSDMPLLGAAILVQ